MYVSLSWILEMYLSTTHSDTASPHARAHTYDSNEHTMHIDHAHAAQSRSRVEDAVRALDHEMMSRSSTRIDEIEIEGVDLRSSSLQTQSFSSSPRHLWSTSPSIVSVFLSDCLFSYEQSSYE